MQRHSMLAHYKGPNIALQAYSLSNSTHKGSVPAFTGNGSNGTLGNTKALTLYKALNEILGN